MAWEVTYLVNKIPLIFCLLLSGKGAQKISACLKGWRVVVINFAYIFFIRCQSAHRLDALDLPALELNFNEGLHVSVAVVNLIPLHSGQILVRVYEGREQVLKRGKNKKFPKQN